MTDAIRATNNDAQESRWSAVSCGYMEDKYVKAFVSHANRREPMINRGTFTRWFGINTLVQNFVLKYKKNSQIISLGAGSDTLYFKLKEKGNNPGMFVEIDFPQITAKKSMAIFKNRATKGLLAEDAKTRGSEIISSDYLLLAGDLNHFAELVKPRLMSLGLELSKPTLFLSECVLIYLEPTIGDAIINAASQFEHSIFITFEQILPNDRFGKIMIQNLLARRVTIPSIESYPTLESQEMRYISNGYKLCKALDMNNVWEMVPDEEKKRIFKLEFLDELEELHLIQSHYCLSWAATSEKDLDIWFHSN